MRRPGSTRGCMTGARGALLVVAEESNDAAAACVFGYCGAVDRGCCCVLLASSAGDRIHVLMGEGARDDAMLVRTGKGDVPLIRLRNRSSFDGLGLESIAGLAQHLQMFSNE